MKLYTVPTIVTVSEEESYSTSSMGSAVVEGVVGGVVGAIVVDMIPGPAIPG